LQAQSLLFFKNSPDAGNGARGGKDNKFENLSAGFFGSG
jgi:hypothetical protein